PVEHLDVAVDRGADDEVGPSVAVDVADSHGDRPVEAGEGGEGEDRGASGAVEDTDLRAAAVAGAGDDVGHSVAGDIARRDAATAGETGERRNLPDHLPGGGIQDAHEGRRARISANQDDPRPGDGGLATGRLTAGGRAARGLTAGGRTAGRRHGAV